MTTWYKGRPIAEYLKGIAAKCSIVGHDLEKITDCDDIPGRCVCAEIKDGAVYVCKRCHVRVAPSARAALTPSPDGQEK